MGAKTRNHVVIVPIYKVYVWRLFLCLFYVYFMQMSDNLNDDFIYLI